MSTGVRLGGYSLALAYNTTPKLSFVGLDERAAIVHARAFGELWGSSFHHKLFVSAGGKTAAVSRGDGGVWSFTGNGTTFTAVAGNRHLLSTVSGGYVFTDTNSGSLEYFNSAGELTSLVSARGDVLTITNSGGYVTSVQSSDGRAVRFSYSNGLITKILAPDSGVITAAYDAKRNLTSLTWQDGRALGFLYESATLPWALTGKVDENNSRLATFAYDEQGRAVSTERAGGANRYTVSHGAPPVRTATLTWNATDDVWERSYAWTVPSGTVVTGPTGRVNALGVQLANGVPVITSKTQPAGSGCPASTRGATWDANGNPESIDHFDGSRTCYAYDASNRVITRVGGLSTSDACATVLSGSVPSTARKITTTWHPDWRQAATTTRPLNKSTTVYHGQADPFNGGATANCTSASAMPNGKALPFVCKQVDQALLSNGSVDSTVADRVNAFAYDSGGRVLSSVDPLGKTTTFAYYSATSFSGTNDPYSDKVTLLLHGGGTNGSTTVTDSSWIGRPLTAAANAQISTTQSKFGGSSISFDGSDDYVSTPYDAALAYGSADFTLETFIYKNANTGNWVSLWGPTTNVYDGVGLWIDATGNIGAYLSTDGATWTYSNASIANLPNGQWNHFALVRSGGSVFAFVNGIKYTITTALGTTALYDNTTVGRALGGVSGVNYTLNGYLDEFRITKGVARYTANFTVPSSVFPDSGPDLNSTGNTIGDLQTSTNAAGHTTTFNLYDPAGRVRQMTDPKGVVTDITYMPRGWVSTVVVTPPSLSARTTTYTYDHAGQLTGVALPDGTSLTYSYDAAHRLIGVTDTRGNTVSYTLDAQGRRVGEEVRDSSSSLQRSIARSFDTLNRLQQVTGARQ